MLSVDAICDFLEQFAPSPLAEEWDNVGLLVGDRTKTVDRIMTCLTVTPESAAEAIDERAELIVTHHPLPFRPLSRLTADETAGRMLLDLIAARVAVYSPHTAFDSAAGGINQRLAEGLGLIDVRPLAPVDEEPQSAGGGRYGTLTEATTLAELAGRLKRFLSIDRLQMVGDSQRDVQTVAVACGSAGEFLEQARRLGCHVLVTGETNFHTCLHARAVDVGLLLPGHFASERFAVEFLADVLQERFTAAAVWASRREANPLQWV